MVHCLPLMFLFDMNQLQGLILKSHLFILTVSIPQNSTATFNVTYSYF